MNFLISAHYFYFASFAGTFTLSNLGMFGVDRFDAILPPGTVGVSTQYEYVPICHILCKRQIILYGLINIIRVLYGYLFILFYAGSNYGCWSI